MKFGQSTYFHRGNTKRTKSKTNYTTQQTTSTKQHKTQNKHVPGVSMRFLFAADVICIVGNFTPCKQHVDL